jgi:adenine-specific DNA-methyltransferase
MASMSSLSRDKVRLLDAGAGVGALTAAWVSEICSRAVRPKEVVLTAYELDEELLNCVWGLAFISLLLGLSLGLHF